MYWRKEANMWQIRTGMGRLWCAPACQRSALRSVEVWPSVFMATASCLNQCGVTLVNLRWLLLRQREVESETEERAQSVSSTGTTFSPVYRHVAFSRIKMRRSPDYKKFIPLRLWNVINLQLPYAQRCCMSGWVFLLLFLFNVTKPPAGRRIHKTSGERM